MNSVTILSVFCILFVLATKSNSADQRFCNLIENEDALKAVVGCVNENMPPFVINLLVECYEENFNEPGSLSNYLEKNCHQEQYQDQIRASIKCMEEKGDEVMKTAGFEEDELDNAVSRTEDCLIALMADDESSNELDEVIEEIEEAI